VKCLFTGRADFLFCLLQLSFDQSAKGDLVLYSNRHDQSAMGIDPMNNISNNNKNTLCSYIILTISTFVMKISEIKDQLGAIGEDMFDRELVLSTLNNLPKHWEPFLQSISGREELPTFDRLWTDYTQEELRLRNRGVEETPLMTTMLLHFIQRKEEDSKETPDKHSKMRRLHYNQRRDISEIQCFRCDKYGQYARNCSSKKKGRQYASTADIEPDPPQKDEDKRDEDYFL
jgi:hypothetical protein